MNTRDSVAHFSFEKKQFSNENKFKNTFSVKTHEKNEERSLIGTVPAFVVAGTRPARYARLSGGSPCVSKTSYLHDQSRKFMANQLQK